MSNITTVNAPQVPIQAPTQDVTNTPGDGVVTQGPPQGPAQGTTQTPPQSPPQGTTQGTTQGTIQGTTKAAEAQAAVAGQKSSKPEADPTIPPPKNSADSSSTSVLPVLIRPNMEVFDLQALLDAVTMDKGGTLKKAALDALKEKGDARTAANAKNLEQIQKNAALLEKKGTLGILSTVFKVLGAVLGVAAGIALACTGGGLLIAAGVMSALLAVNSGLGLIGEGNISLKGLLKVCGVSEKTAGWISFGVEIALTAATIICGGIGAYRLFTAVPAAAAATVEGGVKATQTFALAKNIAKQTVMWGDVAVNIADNSVKIASACNDKDMADVKASQKEISALLKRLTQLMATDQDFFEAVVKKSSELMESVMNIVKENGESQHKLLSNSPQNMA